MAKKKLLVAWFVLLVTVGLPVFSPGIGTPYYGDDFQFIFDTSSNSAYKYFYNNIPGIDFYRPLQASFLWFVQDSFGMNTTPIHLTQIFLHALLSLLVFAAIHRLGFSWLQAAIGSLFMLVSQANMLAVLSNDTFSQITSTLFGCLAVWLIYTSLYRPGDREPAQHNNRWVLQHGYYLSVPALALAYVSKESGISYLVVILLMISLSQKSRRGIARVLPVIIRSAIFLFVTVFYLAIRSHVSEINAELGPGNYEFYLGSNIIKNTGMFLFSVLNPVPSVDAFVWLKTGATAATAAVIAVTALFLIFVLNGLWHARARRKLFVFLGSCGFIVLFPMILLNHVSELYTYNATPFVSFLVGVGLGQYLEQPGKRTRFRAAIISIIILVFLAHVFAVGRKAGMMRESGRRATVLLNQIERHVNKVPPGGTIILVNPPCEIPDYSWFKCNGFNVLKCGLIRINQLSNRYDFEVKIVECCDVVPGHSRSGESTVILTLSGDETNVVSSSP